MGAINFNEDQSRGQLMALSMVRAMAAAWGEDKRSELSGSRRMASLGSAQESRRTTGIMLKKWTKQRWPFGGLELEPIAVEEARADYRAYDGVNLVQMVHGVWLRLLKDDAYCEKLFVFRRQQMDMYSCLSRLDLYSLAGEPARCLDIGANIGYFASILARRSDVASIAAFEPNPAAASILEYNLRPSKKCVIAPLICSSSSEENLIFVSDADNSARSRTFAVEESNRFEKTEDYAAVPVTSIDEWVSMVCFGRVDLIKIDTEGSESSVLEGAREVINRDRPVLIVEVPVRKTDRDSFLESVRSILEFSSSETYNLMAFDKDGELRAVQVKDVDSGAFSDVLLVPRRLKVRKSR